MPDPVRTRFVLERIGLVLLGPLVLLIVSPLGRLTGPLLALGIAFGAAAVVAGLIEAAAARRTGRRRRIGAWLPTILGVLVPVAVIVALEPKGPDSGLALSILLAGVAVIVPLFALVVILVAAMALRTRPGRRESDTA